ncbi:MAG: hypothetical protein K1X94_17535 [Sandaracinaceae bacterium]|nr:hypothetical protein [Sandaracinaceae bacterium]
MRRAAIVTLALLGASAALGACSSGPRPRVRTVASGSEGLREDQADAETGNMAELVWSSDSEQPSIWSFRGGRDYFVPRVGLRFVTPADYAFDTSLEPSQHALLQGPQVPRAVRGERLYGDRRLQIRGASSTPVVVSLLEIPLDVEPATFCAWASRSAEGEPAVSRDEAERLASSTTRLCELRTPSRTTRVRGFLRAGWLLVFSQQIGEDGATVELDALVGSVRSFDEQR